MKNSKRSLYFHSLYPPNHSLAIKGKVHCNMNGRLFNGESLAKILLLPLNTKNDTIVSYGYIKWGKNVFSRLDGEYSIILYDYSNREVIGVKDHMGTVPLFYVIRNREIILSSCSKTIKTLTNPSLNDEWIYKMLKDIPISSTSTPFNDICSIKAGSYLSFSEHGAKLCSYHNLKDIESKDISEANAIEIFQDLFVTSIRKRYLYKKKNGLELSGGLDSSGICGGLRKLGISSNEINLFSNLKPKSLNNSMYHLQDEKDDILSILKHCNYYNHHSIDRDDGNILSRIRSSLERYGFPFLHNYQLFNDYLYESAAENKIDILFSGFGGDQLISHRGGGYFDELAKKKLFLLLWKELSLSKNKDYGRPRFKNFLNITLRTYFSNFHRLLKYYRKNDYRVYFQQLHAISDSFENKNKFKYQKNSYNNLKNYTETLLNKIYNPMISERLDWGYAETSFYNIRYTYPLLDKDLQEFYISIPNSLKFKNGWNRYIYRMAIDGMVPKNIQWKSSKRGSAIPTVYQRFINDRYNIEEYLHNLRRQGAKTEYIDINKMIRWFNKVDSIPFSKNKAKAHANGFYKTLTLLIYLEEFHDGPQ